MQWTQATRFIQAVGRAFLEDRAALAAAAVAFFLVVSLIPLMLLLISVASYFITVPEAQELASALTRTFGSAVGGAVREEILSVVRNRGLLTGISLLVGLWTGSQVFVFIEEALNHIWGVEEGRPFWIRRGMALLMVLVTGLLLALAVGLVTLTRLFGELSIPLLGRHISELPWVMSILIHAVLPILLATLVFALVYRYLSARRVPWHAVFPGALVAAVLWVLALQAFGWYTAHIANFSLLYGSFGGLILLMLWFNYSAQIMLLGAEVAATLDHARKKREERRGTGDG
jgi:membrane protein